MLAREDRKLSFVRQMILSYLKSSFLDPIYGLPLSFGCLPLKIFPPIFRSYSSRARFPISPLYTYHYILISALQCFIPALTKRSNDLIREQWVSINNPYPLVISRVSLAAPLLSYRVCRLADFSQPSYDIFILCYFFCYFSLQCVDHHKKGQIFSLFHTGLPKVCIFFHCALAVVRFILPASGIYFLSHYRI